MGQIDFDVPVLAKLSKNDGSNRPAAAPVYDLQQIKLDEEYDPINLLYFCIFSGNYFYYGNNSSSSSYNNKRRRRKHQNQLKRLPRDIQAEIMARLPATSILRLRSVCHDWYDMSCEPSIIVANLAHADKGYLASHDKDKFHLIETNNNRNAVFRLRPLPSNTHIMGSCNGIICLGWYNYNAPDYYEYLGAVNAIYLYNPLLGGDYLELSHHPIFPSYASVNYGFCFDHVKSEFKVVVFVGDREFKFKDDNLVVNVWIETCTIPMVGEHIGTPQPWKIIQSEIYINNNLDQHTGIPLILVNGKLHVLVNRNMITSFDIATEEIASMSLYFVDRNSHWNLGMGELGGRLFVTYFIPPCEYGNIDELWVMEDYNNPESWSKRLSVRGVLNLYPYLLNEDEIFLLPYRHQAHLVQHTPSLVSIPSAKAVPP